MIDGWSIAAASGDHMSRLEISANPPPRRSAARDAATIPVDVSELITASTGAPPVCSAASRKAVSRELATRVTPISRNIARFRGLPAVANTSIPRDPSTWHAARPTPPVAAWTSTDFKSPLAGTARSSARSTVQKIVGHPAASAKVIPGGFSAAASAHAVTRVPRHPGASPKISVPGANARAPDSFAPPNTTPA